MTRSPNGNSGRASLPAAADSLVPETDLTGPARVRHLRFSTQVRGGPKVRRIVLAAVPAHGRHRDNNREITVYGSHVPKLMDALRAADVSIDEWPVGG